MNSPRADWMPGAAMPAGYSRYGTDADDGNASVTESLDDDLEYVF